MLTDSGVERGGGGGAPHMVRWIQPRLYQNRLRRVFFSRLSATRFLRTLIPQAFTWGSNSFAIGSPLLRCLSSEDDARRPTAGGSYGQAIS